MAVRTYYPPEIFRFLSELAYRRKLSIKEVETIFLRKQSEALGFSCSHSMVGFSKSDKRPYCKGCWTRLEQIKAPVYSGSKVKVPGQFRPLKTFLDQVSSSK